MTESVKKVTLYQKAAKANLAGGDNTYQNLRIHALPGLHEKIADLAKRYCINKARILDLAAGSGALSLRLSDMGFDVSSVDYVAENYRLHDKLTFYQMDLNSDFHSGLGEGYDCLIAIEVIEHLENPGHFLRQLRKLCTPSTTVIISTPNIDSPVSKALFCRTGQFRWFTDHNYISDGHITPVSHSQFHKMCQETGFIILEELTIGDPFKDLKKWLKLKYFARLIKFISQSDDSLDGEIYIAVLSPEKAPPGTSPDK